MKPRSFKVKGFCTMCRVDAPKVEVWVTLPYSIFGDGGKKTNIEGGAFVIAVCHGARDERHLEFNIGLLVSQMVTKRIKAPFFNAEHIQFVPLCDREPVGSKPFSTRKKFSAAELETIEYEKMFSPKPKIRKRNTRYEQEHRRNCRDERVPLYARRNLNTSDI